MITGEFIISLLLIIIIFSILFFTYKDNCKPKIISCYKSENSVWMRSNINIVPGSKYLCEIQYLSSGSNYIEYDYALGVSDTLIYLNIKNWKKIKVNIDFLGRNFVFKF